MHITYSTTLHAYRYTAAKLLSQPGWQILMLPDPSTDSCWGVFIFGVTNLVRAACVVGVMDGSTVPTGVATIAMGCCCCDGVCSALDDNSVNTYKTQITINAKICAWCDF